MFVIADRTNGMFSDVNQAIQTRDAAAIQRLAKAQLDGGATALDINAGRKVKDVEGTLLWMAETIREITDAPLCIDTAKPEIMKAVLPRVPGAKLMNSTTADPAMAVEYIGLAVENGAGLIGLTIDAQGVPGNVEKRIELGAQLIALALEGGLSMDKLFIDPIMLPIKVTSMNPTHCLLAISQLKAFSDPAPHFILGLSNVSDGCVATGLIDRTYVAMAIAHGLDAVFMDPRDKELMDSVIAAELLLAKSIYCDSFLEAARQAKG